MADKFKTSSFKHKNKNTYLNFDYFYLEIYATKKVKFGRQKTIKILSLERFLDIG